MSDPVRPPRLRAGDTVRVVAPSLSRAAIDGPALQPLIEARFADRGLRLTYAPHIDEINVRGSAPIASRVADLHDAFADDSVAGIITVIGGYNCNELLPHLDFDLIAAHPKILCGYSDITALTNAILARSNLVTYYGPHWSTFGMREHLEQTMAWFDDVLLDDDPVTIRPSATYTDDAWFRQQDDRTVHRTDGWWTITSGSTAGRLIGGHLNTLNLLQGTPFMPEFQDAVLVVEADEQDCAANFVRDLTSLLQQPGAETVRGLVIGRFQRVSAVVRQDLDDLLSVHPLLQRIPVLANVDVGHTTPMATLPIGGRIELHAQPDDPHLVLSGVTGRRAQADGTCSSSASP